MYKGPNGGKCFGHALAVGILGNSTIVDFWLDCQIDNPTGSYRFSGSNSPFYALAEIGRRLGRPASTIMREVTRNGGPDDYRADRAHRATRDRARRHKRDRPPAPPLPDSGHGRDPREVQDMTESSTELLVRQGLPRMEARVPACLHFTDSGALTAADLVQRLRVSPRRSRTPSRSSNSRQCCGGNEFPAGARFESSAELLVFVSEALQRAMERWREHLAARDTGRE